MPVSNRPAVVARDLSKTYWVGKDGTEIGIGLKRHGIQVDALQPISFVAYQGEAVGIIGKNGSGKSTLLNLIAGHERPTSGSIWVSSQPSLLSVSAALQQHLTGLQNVRLGLLASGFSPKEAKEREQEVAEWADIGDAINRPMNTYSSGMEARLRFSIATAVHTDILLVDEALATGDSTFTERAKQRMNNLLESDSSVFIVSHSPGVIQDNCTRAIWIHEGQTITDGDADQVCRQYKRWSDAEAKRDRVTAGKVVRRALNDYHPPQIIFDSEAADLLEPVHTKRKGWFRKSGRHAL